jgi:thiol-disulfide isomerase/thioredoxin
VSPGRSRAQAHRACVAAAAAGFFVSLHLYGEPATDPAIVGAPAPEIALADLDGRPLRLAEWRGKLVLVNFWASWCAPCMHELPLLVEAQQRYAARGLQIVGPALDEPEAVRPVVARFGIGYPVSADYAAVDRALRALGNDQGALPYSVLIGRDGRVLRTVLGGLEREEIARLVEEFLDD